MRFSFVPLLEVNLGVVVTLFLLRVAFPLIRILELRTQTEALPVSLADRPI